MKSSERQTRIEADEHKDIVHLLYELRKLEETRMQRFQKHIANINKSMPERLEGLAREYRRDISIMDDRLKELRAEIARRR